MDQVEDAPGCAHHVHVPGGRLGSEPTLVCSCPAGLIHMHDCPVTLGLDCVHFQPAPGPTEVAPADYEKLHAALMDVFLSRAYVHRIRGLAPAGDDWQRRRDLLHAEYSVEAGEADEPLAEDEVARYEEERDRLIALRKKREEREREREERSREERAKERARMGIKTVVEKAVDAVASTGNVASSVVDDMKLEGAAAAKKRRRRRRKAKGGDAAAQGESGGAKPEGARKRRRRRRRKRKPGEGSSS